MGKEQNEMQLPRPKDLDFLFDQKGPRLAPSIRRHIRHLKSQGKLELALSISTTERERKAQMAEEMMQSRARNELRKTTRALLETDDPQIEAEQEIRAIWLLAVCGELNSQERTEELIQALNTKAPTLQAVIEGKLPEIRDEVQKFFPRQKLR